MLRGLLQLGHFSFFQGDLLEKWETSPVGCAPLTCSSSSACVTVALVLNDQLTRVRERIAQAARRCGRDPSAICLIGVTKQVPVEQIAEAVALGLADIGENRVQEARAKQPLLSSKLQAASFRRQPAAGSLRPVRWHLIGHLQRNKAKEAVALFDVIHSVDSLELIDTLRRQTATQGKTIEVLIQVNVSGEATKFGCRPEEAASLAEAVRHSEHLHLTGLMTIAPFADDPQTARPHFRRLRELRDQVVSGLTSQVSCLKLSMGMSSDFEVAIEEGADMVRIGTAIFGARTDMRHET